MSGIYLPGGRFIFTSHLQRISADEIPRQDHQGEKCQADEGKYPDKCHAPSRIFPDIDAEIDDRGQGPDEGAEPGAVQAVEERPFVDREGVEDDGGWHVGDDLGEENAPGIFVVGDSAL